MEDGLTPTPSKPSPLRSVPSLSRLSASLRRRRNSSGGKAQQRPSANIAPEDDASRPPLPTIPASPEQPLSRLAPSSSESSFRVRQSDTVSRSPSAGPRNTSQNTVSSTHRSKSAQSLARAANQSPPLPRAATQAAQPAKPAPQKPAPASSPLRVAPGISVVASPSPPSSLGDPQTTPTSMRLLRSRQNGSGASATSQAPPSAASAATADALRDTGSGYFLSVHDKDSAARRSSSSLGIRGNSSIDRHRRASETSGSATSADSAGVAGGFRTLGRRFMFKSAANTASAEHSPYLYDQGRSGSYSSESTAHSSPPRTPTTPTTPPRLSAKEGHHLRLGGGLPQLPPLGTFSLSSDGSGVTSTTGPGAWSSLLASANGDDSVSPKGTRVATPTSLSITIPTPARTSSVLRDPSPRVTVSPLPTTTSPTSPTTPAHGLSTSLPIPKSLSIGGSLFDESSDLLQAVLSLGEGDSTTGIFAPDATTPLPSSSAGMTASYTSSFAFESSMSQKPGSLPRRLTEAQLNQLAEEERQSRGSSRSQTTSRPKLTTRPGLFATKRTSHDSDDSEDEYGEAEREESEADDVETNVTPSAAVASNHTKGTPSEATFLGVKAGSSGSKFASFLKSRSANANAALKTPSASLVLARSPNPADGPGSASTGSFPSSFSFAKKNRSPAPSLKSPTTAVAPQNQLMGPAADEASAPPSDATRLPGLTSPAKRALYACTLLKVHPQLESLLKVGIAAGTAAANHVPVEIRYPRSINSASKLQAASRSGGSQAGVAGASITQGARRLDVALGQTKVMRKLRRRLPRSEEVEIGWFLRDYASELVSPEAIFRSLATKPQVSPEALAQPPAASLDTSDGRGELQSNSSADAGNKHKGGSTAADTVRLPQPNGLAVWATRKPFLERCSLIRGEDDSSLNVGDVVLDHTTQAVSPVVSADTFRVGHTVRAPSRSPEPKRPRQEARPGQIALSPRVRILAGLPLQARDRVGEPLQSKRPRQPAASQGPKAPPPWIAARQKGVPVARTPSPSKPISANPHVSAAHDKLIGRNRGATQSESDLARTTTTSSRDVLSSRTHLQAAEEDTGAETSGNEYFSADDTDDEQEDDIPIAALGRTRSQQPDTDNCEAADEGDSSSTLRVGSVSTELASPSATQQESQRIMQLEHQLKMLKMREREQESRMAAERLHLARLHDQQQRSMELEEQKRQLRAARERRSRTDHSSVLQDKSYGAGDAVFFESHARRLRQSASMADMNAGHPGLAPSWQPTTASGSSRRISQQPSTGRSDGVSPLHSPRSPSSAALAASPLMGSGRLASVPSALLSSPTLSSSPSKRDLSAKEARVVYPQPATRSARDSSAYLSPASAAKTTGYAAGQTRSQPVPRRESSQAFTPFQTHLSGGMSASMTNLAASGDAAHPYLSPGLSSIGSQPNLLSHRASTASLASVRQQAHQQQMMMAAFQQRQQGPQISAYSPVPHSPYGSPHWSQQYRMPQQPLVQLRSTDVPPSALSVRDA
ncbi:unnamed protein product [Parajaminaea phylloscopi]